MGRIVGVQLAAKMRIEFAEKPDWKDDPAYNWRDDVKASKARKRQMVVRRQDPNQDGMVQISPDQAQAKDE